MCALWVSYLSPMFFHLIFRSLEGLDIYDMLTELVLDNNLIDDKTEFPKLSALTTLTLNKNCVSYSVS